MSYLEPFKNGRPLFSWPRSRREGDVVDASAYSWDMDLRERLRVSKRRLQKRLNGGITPPAKREEIAAQLASAHAPLDALAAEIAATARWDTDTFYVFQSRLGFVFQNCKWQWGQIRQRDMLGEVHSIDHQGDQRKPA